MGDRHLDRCLGTQRFQSFMLGIPARMKGGELCLLTHGCALRPTTL